MVMKGRRVAISLMLQLDLSKKLQLGMAKQRCFVSILQIHLYPLNGCRPMFFLEDLIKDGFALKAGKLSDPFDGGI